MNGSGYPRCASSTLRLVGHLPDVTFLSFGKPKDIWRPILKVYEQRLAKAISFKHVILREKGDGADSVKANASKLLEPHMTREVFVVLFDERGKPVTSPGFAKLLASARPKKVSAIIGTSYGVGADVVERADRVVNLGSITLPHEIARATALEQLYRAETILAGHPYHHS